jgi:AcrR family transcriptional regulator
VPAAKSGYHKGDLREKLLREAARTISQSGIGALSMRKLAGRLKISRTAAYHHFDHKDHLLAAVGQYGFRRLAARMQKAGVEKLPALGALRAALLAYVRFSTEETEFFRLMFANVLKRPLRIDTTEELRPFAFSSPEAFGAFAALVTAVKRCQAEGSLGPGDPLFVANILHAFVHGVARLQIDDHLKIGCPVEEFLNRGLDVALRGLGMRTAESKDQK